MIQRFYIPCIVLERGWNDVTISTCKKRISYSMSISFVVEKVFSYFKTSKYTFYTKLRKCMGSEVTAFLELP